MLLHIYHTDWQTNAMLQFIHYPCKDIQTSRYELSFSSELFYLVAKACKFTSSFFPAGYF